MRKRVEVKIVSPLIGDRIPLPEYATEGSAGLDLRACTPESVAVEPGRTEVIHSGIALNIHDTSIMAVIAPRSGLGIKHGIVLANLIGVIDSDYQGEIKIAIWNRGKDLFTIAPGDRICQMIFVPVVQVALTVVSEFGEISDRGSGGFGHTGNA